MKKLKTLIHLILTLTLALPVHSDENWLGYSQVYGDIRKEGIYCSYDPNSKKVDLAISVAYYQTYQCYRGAVFTDRSNPVDISKFGEFLGWSATLDDKLEGLQSAFPGVGTGPNSGSGTTGSGSGSESSNSSELKELAGQIVGHGLVAMFGYSRQFNDRMAGSTDSWIKQKYASNMAEFASFGKEMEGKNRGLAQGIRSQLGSGYNTPTVPSGAFVDATSASASLYTYAMPVIYDHTQEAQKVIREFFLQLIEQKNYSNAYLQLEALIQQMNPTEETKKFLKEILNESGIIRPEKINHKSSPGPFNHFVPKTKANTPNGVAVRQIINRGQMAWAARGFTLPVPAQQLGEVSRYLALHGMVNIADLILSGAEKDLYSFGVANLFLAISKTYADIALGIVSGAEDSLKNILQLCRNIPDIGMSAYRFLQRTATDPESVVEELVHLYSEIPLYRKILAQTINEKIDAIGNAGPYDFGHLIGGAAIDSMISFGKAGTLNVTRGIGEKAMEQYIQSDLPVAKIARQIKLNVDESRIGRELPIDFTAGKIAKKHKMVGFETAEEVNNSLHKGNSLPPYLPGTFIQKYKLSSSEEFVQFWSAGKTSPGTWLVKKESVAGLSPAQIQNKLSLPSLPTRFVTATIPEGQILRRGKANGLFGGGEGAIQYQLVADKLPSKWVTAPLEIGDSFEP